MSQGDIQFSETQRGNSGGEQQTHNSKRLATQFFMANAPPGKLREVMENCELLVDPAAVSDRFMQETLEQAAEDRRQFVSVSSPGAAPYEASPKDALLCSAASFGKSQYLHPPTKSLLTVAARASDLVVTSSVPAPPEAFPPALEQHRACSWSSEWRVFFSLSDASSLVYIEGEMEVRAFLYEDSSIQASFSRVFRVEDKNPFISSSSTEDKTNTTLKTAKSLRRVLPVYAKPFDWKQQSIQLQPQQLSVE
ncbi:hypothetical protein Emed_002757 [Eimeria media]